MGSAPREKFVPADRKSTAYMDRSVPIGGGRVLNPPLATGLMLGAAELRAEDKVLVIGAATGYLVSLIASRTGLVFGVEQAAELLVQARANLATISNVELIEGALNEGYAVAAPYSLVIIDGAISHLPEGIMAQISEGGRIICGLSDGAVSRLAIGFKRGENVVLRVIADCEIPAIPGFERAKEFVF